MQEKVRDNTNVFGPHSQRTGRLKRVNLGSRRRKDEFDLDMLN